MRCVDVNVLVYAHRREAERHDAYRAWLDDVRIADEPLGVPALVLSGFLRVVTHPRVFKDPTPLSVAIEFTEALRSAPASMPVDPGARHWDIFVRLVRESDGRGNTIPDAYLAALAMEKGATWFSADRGFARFRGLEWRHPLDP